jgi:phosphoglycolate phosphatase
MPRMNGRDPAAFAGMGQIRGVLFDLDGTLADTAPDLGGALNDLLDKYDRAHVPLERLRPRASSGARGMLAEGFGIGPADPFYEELREEYYQAYEARLCRDTVLFDGVAAMIAALEARAMPWGIVTNKVARFAQPLIAQLAPLNRANCLVCGDTYDRPKPYPDPLLGAAGQLGLAPQNLIYVGDDERDMQAAVAAGMGGVVARYGYLGIEAPPGDWPAHHHIDHPAGVLDLLGP